MPEDLNGMFAIKKIIAKRGDTNLKLENNIIKVIIFIILFLVFTRNRLISGGLEPVLIHTKKNYV